MGERPPQNAILAAVANAPKLPDKTPKTQEVHSSVNFNKANYRITIELDLWTKDMSEEEVYAKSIAKFQELGFKSVKEIKVAKRVPKKDLYSDGRNLL